MDRMEFRGYIADTDDLGRPYIYNTSSPYSEDSDRIFVNIDDVKQEDQIKLIIDARIEFGEDFRTAWIEPNGTVCAQP